MRVLFPYISQLHQILHSLPIAAELAQRYPHIEVRAAGATAAHVEFVQRLLQRFAPQAPVTVDRLASVLLPRWRRKRKRRLLLRNLNYLRAFDAIVTPERTSLFLKRFDMGATKIIWSGHGAGDRAIGFAEDIHQFDYVLMAGRKLEARLLAAGQVRPGHYATDVYAKFAWLRGRQPLRLFDNERPVVLYNPHFELDLGSWALLGEAVLDFFAQRPQWNLIFAPHVRLFDRRKARKGFRFDRYRALPNMLIDLGSERSIDMTYVEAADLYLGDVSSQVVEFLCRPRPCVFLNAHRVAWQGDPNYRFWRMGPVIDTVDELESALHQAVAAHGEVLGSQREYVEDSFGSETDSSAVRGADVIVDYLRLQGASAGWRVANSTLRMRTPA